MSSTPPEAPGAPDPAWAAVFAPLAPQDPREVSGYLLRARIGEGGMGAVYLSYTPGGRPVAFKIARAEFAADPEFRRRFEKEVTIAQRVQGLYTAPVIDCDPQAPRPWLATAYVAAPSLARAVAHQGALPAESVLVLIAGVAEALQSIHAAGVIHRDLKPGNVILASDGPRVIDFGISRAVEASSAALTQTGARIGTPAFMAPEHVQGKPLGAAGDVFSLGSTAYYAITGEYPFGGDAAIFHRIVYEQPDWDRCPDQIRPVLERCVEKDPADRPTPAELIELCREASTDERLRIGEGWLPPTVRADLTRYVLTPPPSVGSTDSGSHPPTPPAPTPWSPPPAPPGPRRSSTAPRVVGALGLAVLLLVAVVILAKLGDGSSDNDSLGGSGPFPTTEASGTGSGEESRGSAGNSTAAAESGPARKPTAATGPVDRYLMDMESVQPPASNQLKTGSASISGVTFIQSVILQNSSGYAGESSIKIEYDLGRDFNRFQATVGLSDDATSDTTYQIEIFGDGRRLASNPVQLGDSIPLDLDVTGILRLRLVSTKAQADYYDQSYSVFGDARVTGGQSGTPD